MGKWNPYKKFEKEASIVPQNVKEEVRIIFKDILNEANLYYASVKRRNGKLYAEDIGEWAGILYNAISRLQDIADEYKS